MSLRKQSKKNGAANEPPARQSKKSFPNAFLPNNPT